MHIEEPEKLLEQIKRDASPSQGAIGRPPVARRRREVAAKIRAGADKVDKGWLLEQLLSVYGESGIRPLDRLRALELMSRISGYSGKNEVPADERQALQDLMRDMEGNDDGC